MALLLSIALTLLCSFPTLSANKLCVPSNSGVCFMRTSLVLSFLCVKHKSLSSFVLSVQDNSESNLFVWVAALTSWTSFPSLLKPENPLGRGELISFSVFSVAAQGGHAGTSAITCSFLPSSSCSPKAIFLDIF
uniref:Uncharacterized protein MANES_12G045400 n=1 Tax=Rhizophora mucronata TaxID=61149 RepID=A0A2P2MXM3_RHIMU